MRARGLVAAASLALGLVACENLNNKDSGGSGSGGSGSGSGGGSSSGGSGSEGGNGQGSGPSDVECDEEVDPLSYDSSTCIAHTLSCGETISGINTGGPSNVDGSDYSSIWACEVTGEQSYTGPEMHYEFIHPGDGEVFIYLDSPCANLDLFVMQHDGGCVSSSSQIFECEADISSDGGSVRVWNNEPKRYVIIVEAPTDVFEPYELSLDCPGSGL
jgi:hypothetical protein